MKNLRAIIVAACLILGGSYITARVLIGDELQLAGYSVTGIRNDLTDNSSSLLPTQSAVYNAIAEAEIAGGTTLTGWYNVLDNGFVSDGTFTTGTDNTAAMVSLLSTAPENSVIFIPRGSFMFSDSIVLPTSKRLTILSYAELYFRKSGFIVDGAKGHKLILNGRVLGDDESGTPNYSGQTSSGVWVRNSRNNEITLNVVSGFKYAVRVGGHATGSATAEGAQYNKISWNWLWRNSVGIYVHPSGGTTDANGNWSNECFYYGGQITTDTGIIFRRDPLEPAGDRMNGHKFYNVGFEYAGPGPMSVGIWGEFAFNNTFFGGRFEPNGVTKKLELSSNCDNFSFYGWYFNDTWLASPGNNISITGAIYEEDNGLCLGNYAQGYNYSGSSYFDGRVRVYGNQRSLSAAVSVASNIDVVYQVDDDLVATTSPYNIPAGAKFIKSNYSSGTGSIVLPTPASASNESRTVRNVHASNSTVVSQTDLVGDGTLLPGQSKTFHSDGVNWYVTANTSKSAGVFGKYHVVTDANVTVAEDDYSCFIYDMSTGRTMTLPDPAVYPNRVIVIGQRKGNTNTITLSRNIYFGSTDSPTSSILSNNTYTIQSDGTRWQVLMQDL